MLTTDSGMGHCQSAGTRFNTSMGPTLGMRSGGLRSHSTHGGGRVGRDLGAVVASVDPWIYANGSRTLSTRLSKLDARGLWTHWGQG